MPFGIKWIGSGLYFDGFGELSSLLYAKTFPQWKDCPLKIEIRKRVFRYEMGEKPALGFYVGANGIRYLKIVELNNEKER